MVEGLKKFTKHFEGLEDAYVLIGGAACDIWLSERALPFRATKDLDVVIIVEALNAEFFSRFWTFIQEGRYESHQKSEQHPEFYRFLEPQAPDYPFMIELLTRNLLGFPEGVHLTPIPADEDISSLSAILLNDDYYRLVVESRVVIDGVSVVPAKCLIPLKARAWLDLTRRRDAGDKTIKGSDIKKHRNDVFRLYRSLALADRYDLPELLKSDIRAFIENFTADSKDWQAISQAIGENALPDPQTVIHQFRAIFML